MSTDRGKDKEDAVPTHNALLFCHKKNKMMSFAAPWMDLEVIIPSGASQAEKDSYRGTSLLRFHM